jgi:hypothetical protein
MQQKIICTCVVAIRLLMSGSVYISFLSQICGRMRKRNFLSLSLSLSLPLCCRCVEDGIPVSSGHASRNLIRKGYINQVCFSLIDLLVSFLLNDVEEFFLCCRCAEEGIHSYMYQEIL